MGKPVRMTQEEYEARYAKAEAKTHPVLFMVISGWAYQRGHSGGREETINLLEEMITDFNPVNDLLLAQRPVR